MKPSNVWKKRYKVEKVLLHRYKAVSLFSCICVIICFCVAAHFRANYSGGVGLFPCFDETWLWLHSSSALCRLDLLETKTASCTRRTWPPCTLEKEILHVFPPVCVSRPVSLFGLPEANATCSRD